MAEHSRAAEAAEHRLGSSHRHHRHTPQISYADIDQRIAEALRAERSVVIPTIRRALDEILDAEREHREHALLERTRGLELAIAKLESALAQLQLTLVAERSGKPLDANLRCVN